MTRVLIVDDHRMIRQVLRALLEKEPDLEVCGEAGTGAAALEQAAGTDPGLILVDVSLPDMTGFDLVREMLVQRPGQLLAMLTAHKDESYVEKAFEAGASGYIQKGKARDLMAGVRQVLGGERYVSGER